MVAESLKSHIRELYNMRDEIGILLNQAHSNLEHTRLSKIWNLYQESIDSMVLVIDSVRESPFRFKLNIEW